MNCKHLTKQPLSRTEKYDGGEGGEVSPLRFNFRKRDKYGICKEIRGSREHDRERVSGQVGDVFRGCREDVDGGLSGEVCVPRREPRSVA